jgi:Na+/H+ antiporter NhaD/arsenite permease-like protein
MILALAQEHIDFWWITLGMGAVVIIAVIVLLSLLIAFVDDIDVNVREVWDTATRLAANTATTWMFQQTTVRTAELDAEVQRHAQLLNAQGGR